MLRGVANFALLFIAAALIAGLRDACAQDLPGQQPVLPDQQPLLPGIELLFPWLDPKSSGQGGAYTYTARTVAPVAIGGQVTAAGIAWSCVGSTCTVTGPWPAPAIGACHALAQRVGPINAYGRPGRQLSRAELRQCNAGLESTTAAQPAPAPDEQKTEGVAYGYFAKTTGRVALTGRVRAAGVDWQCTGSTCTVEVPWPSPDVKTCQALAQRVGQIGAYGRPGRLLTAAELRQCNAGLESTTAAQPAPAPDEQKTEGVAYGYFAKTTGLVALTGRVRAAGVDWQCTGSTCTVEVPWPSPDVKTCQALAQRVGQIGAYGRPGRQLTAAELRQCNSSPATVASLPEPPPKKPSRPEAGPGEAGGEADGLGASSGPAGASDAGAGAPSEAAAGYELPSEPTTGRDGSRLIIATAGLMATGTFDASAAGPRVTIVAEPLLATGTFIAPSGPRIVIAAATLQATGLAGEAGGAAAGSGASSGPAGASAAGAEPPSEVAAGYELPSEPTAGRDGSRLIIATAGLMATGTFDASAAGPRVTIITEPLLATGTFVAPSGPRIVIAAATLQATGMAGPAGEADGAAAGSGASSEPAGASAAGAEPPSEAAAGYELPSEPTAGRDGSRLIIATAGLMATGTFDASAVGPRVTIITEPLLATGTFVALSGPRIMIETPPLLATGLGEAP